MSKNKDLRKGIKIKAYTFFLCWLMIFAHSIIPHNHVDSDSAIFSEHNHSALLHQTGRGFSEEFQKKCEDTGICRISGFLFHQFNQDNLILPSGREYHSSSTLQKGTIIYNREQIVYINKFYGSASLRSPPVA